MPPPKPPAAGGAAAVGEAAGEADDAAVHRSWSGGGAGEQIPSEACVEREDARRGIRRI